MLFGKKKGKRDEEKRPGQEGRVIPEPERESDVTREMRRRESGVDENIETGTEERVPGESLDTRREVTGEDSARENE